MRIFLTVLGLLLATTSASADVIGERWEDSDCPSGERESVSHDETECVESQGMCAVSPGSSSALPGLLLLGVGLTVALRRRRDRRRA